MDNIVSELEESGVNTIIEYDNDFVTENIRILSVDADAVVLDWDLYNAESMIDNIRMSDSDIGIFLMADPDSLSDIPVNVVSNVDEFLWVLGDTPSFMAGRIAASCRRYRKTILPPMFKSLVEFSEDYEYSWHTPGHTAGAAFLKNSTGRLFYDFFGEQLFRSDLSISVGEVGSLLDHSGPIGAAEKYASKVFGSDFTMFVTNGTSTSNRVVHMALTPPGGVEVVDRNCHKSIEHSLTMSHAIPVYMVPSRNGYGIMGPIPPEGMTPGAIEKSISESPFLDVKKGIKPTLAVVTNSTYDGICYNAEHAEYLLSKSVDNIHFDEAWYAYARFNPLYEGRFAMRDVKESDATVFSTQSTHKLLAALSQASMVHVRNGKKPIEKSIFNETFMMHASTSPQYAIIASLDVSSKMMDSSGYNLTQDSIDEAIRFRQMMARIGSQKKKDWWFGVWQPEYVTVPGTHERCRFEDAPAEMLGTESSCWILSKYDSWHGFENIEDNWAMLDPIKVTVLTPGIDAHGNYSDFGIPAAMVVSYLDEKGIVNEKSGDYNILFLFSMGVANGKWGTLVSELCEFKRLFDSDEKVSEVLPKIYATDPKRYEDVTLKQLASEMHRFMKERKQTNVANMASSMLPEQKMTPADAYRELITGNVEHVKVSEAENRIAATGIVPYPPGVPVLMPGEFTGRKNEPILMYLRTLQDFDKKFPGFEHDSHGIEVIDGEYYMYCVKE